jgi:hypothetical protein
MNHESGWREERLSASEKNLRGNLGSWLARFGQNGMSSSLEQDFQKVFSPVEKVSSPSMAVVLAQLLVTETVRELEQIFEDANDRDSRIQAALRQIGVKPGWGLTAQIALTGNDFLDTVDQISDFLVGKFSLAVFGVTGTRGPVTLASDISKTVTLTFDNKPSWFLFMGPPNTQPTPAQTFWFNAYANFMIGVLTGAFLHLGLKATGGLDRRPGLSFVFSVKELDGMWEFAAN